jgi:hypothetical protein
VKYACEGLKRGGIFSVSGRFLLILVLEVKLKIL